MKAEIRRDCAGGIVLSLQAESNNEKSLLGLLADHRLFSVQGVTSQAADGAKMPYEVSLGPVPPPPTIKSPVDALRTLV